MCSWQITHWSEVTKSAQTEKARMDIIYTEWQLVFIAEKSLVESNVGNQNRGELSCSNTRISKTPFVGFLALELRLTDADGRIAYERLRWIE